MTKKDYIIQRESDKKKIFLAFRHYFGFISVGKIAEITGIDSRRVVALLRENMGFVFKLWHFVFGQL